MSLSNQVFKGAFWLYGLRIVTKLLSLTSGVVLARLLTPSDFGLIGMATLAIGLLEVFSRSGLEHSIIQKTHVSRHELDTLWTFDVLRGVVLAGLMLLSAPYVGAFFGSPGSIPVLRAMSVVCVLMFLQNIDMAVMVKKLEFHKVFVIEGTQVAVAAVVGVVLVLLSPNVWALVASSIAGHFARVIASHLVCPSRARFVWDWPVVKRHFRYGRQILITAIAQYSYNNIDDWFVGKMMGQSALGLYRRAYRLGNLPTIELTLVLGRVLFPSFSTLKDDRERLRRAFLQVQQTLALVVMPISALLFFLAAPLVHILYGDQWMPMVPAFQVLVLWGGLRALRETAGSVFRAIGRPAIVAYTTFVKLVVLAILLWPACQYGIAGVGTVVFLTSLLEFPTLMWFIARWLNVPYISLYRLMLLPGVVAFCVGLLTFLASVGESAWTRLFWGLIGTMGGYLLMMIVLEYVFHLTHFTQVRRLWSLVRARIG